MHSSAKILITLFLMLSTLMIVLSFRACSFSLSGSGEYIDSNNSDILEKLIASSSSAPSEAFIHQNSSAISSEESIFDSRAAIDSDKSSDTDDTENQTIHYPTGWLVTSQGDINPGEPIEILYLPDFDVVGQHAGRPVTKTESGNLVEEAVSPSEEEAVIRYGAIIATVDSNLLLVNLPDIMPDLVCDVVYSYSATSNCNGIPLPNITGMRVDGYSDGKQFNEYLNKESYVVPCAYQTTVKLKQVVDELLIQGYRLLVYDAYRPMRAQRALSDAIEAAYYSSPEIQSVLGAWSMNWYVANGPSGHNFGTDLDVAVCDLDGQVLKMPSIYDTFGGAGHLTVYPMDALSIYPDAYTEAVRTNVACSALHLAFVNAGFSELASEWWHFADNETEYLNRAAIGPQGLDFIAEMPY